MAATPERGVVDPRGGVWGTEGLFVVDASVFPGACAVNPMVTVLAVAEWVSGKVGSGLSREKARRGERGRL